MVSEEARAEAERRWAPVLGYEGYYEVSDYGDIRRIAGGSGAKPGHTLKHRIGRDGYPYVGLAKNTEHKNRSVHSLVLEAFVSARPDGMEACHNDGDRANPHLANLRWDTPSGNNQDKKLHGTAHSWLSGREECRNGHRFTPENTYYRDSGYRRCRECDRIAERVRRDEKPRKDCPECGVSVSAQNLSRHIKKMHARAALDAVTARHKVEKP